jgi:hypothetical protein
MNKVTNKDWRGYIFTAIVIIVIWDFCYIGLTKLLQQHIVYKPDFWWWFCLYINPASLTVLSVGILLAVKELKEMINE